jgi:pilus assembly protein CpaC
MPYYYRLKVIMLLLFFLIPVGSAWPRDCSEAEGQGCVIEIEPRTSLVVRTEKPITRVAVAEPKLADVELLTATQVLVVAQDKTGATSLILWHGEMETEFYRIKVRISDLFLKEIQDAIDRLAPGTGVRVERLGDDGVALDGIVESQRDLDRVVEVTKKFVRTFSNMITLKGSQQVQLEVKVAEVSRSGIKQMGLGFLLDRNYIAGISPTGTFSGSAAGLNATGEKNSSSLLSSAELSSPYGSAFQVLLHSLGDNYLLLLNLLKNQGLSRLLASPTLVTMNGQQAEFVVGGEYPYPIAQAYGTTSIQYKQFGIVLRFTPYIVDRETITLVVEPEVSALDYSSGVVSGGTSVPGISTRRAQSTIQLKDGQVFAMAGLLREEVTSSVSKIPFLGDIPVLGTLFTSKSYEERETELVVIVRPRIVTALAADRAPSLPGSSIRKGFGDLDFFLLNRGGLSENASSGNASTRAPKFKGEIGFAR